MKKLLPVAIIVCMALTSCGRGGGSAVNEKVEKSPLTDLQQERLSGKVVSVRQRVYWALEKFGRMEKGKLQNLSAQDYLKVYDDDGYLIEETHYDASDKVVSRKNIEYGTAHQIMLEEIYKETTLSERVVYTYDDNNRLVKKEKFDGAGKIKEWIQYIYGKNGLVEDEDRYKADGTLDCKYIHVYNNAQQLIEKQKYWGGGSLAQKEYYYYDGEDDYLKETVSEKYKNKENSFDYRFVFNDYNTFGDYGERIQYNEDGDKLATTINTYNNLGHLMENTTITLKIVEVAVNTQEEEAEEEETMEESEEIVAIAKLVSTTMITEEYAGQAYEYFYDDYNNWIQKITYKISGVDDSYKKDRQFYYERIITYKPN